MKYEPHKEKFNHAVQIVNIKLILNTDLINHNDLILQRDNPTIPELSAITFNTESSKTTSVKVYLVIGATEMVGAHLVCALLRNGNAVRAIKVPGANTEYTRHILRLYSDDYEVMYNEIDWVELDYSNTELLSDAFQDIQAAICCLDPTVSTYGSIEDNVETVRCILEAAKAAECPYLCYLSSLSALGDEPDHNEITEKSQRDPKGNHSNSSNTYYYCEMEVWRAMQEGLKAGIINSAPILAPGDWIHDKSQFLNDNMAKVYYTDGVTGLVGINDLIKCIMSMIRQKISNENFIVCAANVCYRDLQYLFAKELDSSVATKKAGKFRLLIWKMQYAIKSILNRRRPIINEEFFNDLTRFSLYSNRKSIDRLIICYEDLESTVKNVCKYYRKSMMIEK